MFFSKILLLQNANFSFLQFFFSQLWRTLARKLMKRPAVFITYFQSPGQIMHVHKVSRSAYFFQKFYGGFNLMSMFFAFHHFYEKTYEKTYWFYDLFSKFLWLYIGSQNFFAWNFLIKKWRLFENVINFLFISATLSNVCEKSYEKTYLFFSIFSNFHFSFMCLQNFMTRKLQKKVCRLFQYVNKNLFIAPTLNNIFTKIMKNPTISVTYFWSLFQVLHCHAGLLWPHICNKNGSCFNFANKFLFISNSIFFTSCLSFLFLFTVYFGKYL